MAVSDPVSLLNLVNLTTPCGWAFARAAGCDVRRRGTGWEATGYRWRFPRAGAFTLGCVVISRTTLPERVWNHERVHMRQYALLGPVFWPAYVLAAAYSVWRTGDWWSRNVFERRAGLVAGGYRENPVRRGARWRPGVTAAGAAGA